MPLEMKISPMALYNEDSHIFDDLTLPTLTEETAPSWGSNYLALLRDNLFSMDKTAFINWLLLKTANMSTIYSDPATFKIAVKFWSGTRAKIWQQLWETQFFRYNPIWNKDGTIKLDGSVVRDLASSLDRTDETEYDSTIESDFGHPTETLTRTGGRKETVTDTAAWTEEHTGTDTTTDTLAHTETESYDQYVETHAITQDDTDGSVAAFDASTLVPREKTEHVLTETNTPSGSKVKTLGGGDDVSELEHGETITRTGTAGDVVTEYEYNAGGEVETRTYTGEDSETRDHTGKDTLTIDQDTTDTGSITTDNTTTEQGNIGVTSTQQLIESERNLLRFNMYEYILQDFKENFLILLY